MRQLKTQWAAVIIIILKIHTLHLLNSIRQISSPLLSSPFFCSLSFSHSSILHTLILFFSTVPN